MKLEGCGTALVTPFDSGGGVDLAAWQRLIERQLEAGVDFLVPCGTTGEGATLATEEYALLIRSCVEAVAGRVPVVAGAGSNSTAHALELGSIARREGADAILSVTPYYNKPTQEGLFLHFERLARETGLPLLLYNVPGRTSINLEAATVLRLAGVEGIVGVKEASGDLSQIMGLLAERPPGFALLSGDDALAFPLACLGADGVISVASNLVPGPMSEMIRLARQGRLEEARRRHFRYLSLMRVNFIESNPIPVKYALSRLGLMEEVYRAPLCRPAAGSRRRIEEELKAVGLWRALS